MSDYSTPESLGYTDPDIERARAEAERRRTQGVAGDWEVVVPATTEPPPDAGEDPQHGDDVQNREGDQEAGKKRAVPDTAEEDEGRWKLRKKTTTVGLGEIYDPGIIAIKLRAKAEIKEDETASTTTQPSDDAPAAGDAKATALPKWAPVKWKRAGEPADDTSGEGTPRLADGETVSTEGTSRVVLPDPPDAVEMPAPAPVADVLVKGEPSLVKLEETTASGEAPSGGSLFRKRKAPAGGAASSRGRRF
jgi:WW domain-binding protein 4